MKSGNIIYTKAQKTFKHAYSLIVNKAINKGRSTNPLLNSSVVTSKPNVSEVVVPLQKEAKKGTFKLSQIRESFKALVSQNIKNTKKEGQCIQLYKNSKSFALMDRVSNFKSIGSPKSSLLALN